jgi:hypothetical protein
MLKNLPASLWRCGLGGPRMHLVVDVSLLCLQGADVNIMSNLPRYNRAGKKVRATIVVLALPALG